MKAMMRLGAVALVDALGWKGIWRDGTEALETIETIARAVTERLAYANENLKKGPILFGSPWPESAFTECRFLSDTVVIAAWVDEPQDDTKIVLAAGGDPLHERRIAIDAVVDALCHIACQSVGEVIRHGAQAPRPLAYRGAIATGTFLVEKNTLIGPAVDAAAELMNMPDAALVCLPPHTSSVREDMFTAGSTLTYLVPLKSPGGGGRSVQTRVVDPFTTCQSRDEAVAVRDGILRSFGSTGTLDVVIKKQNTSAFLATALPEDRKFDLP